MSSFGLEVLTPETEPCLVRLPETVAAGEVDAWLAGGALVEIANWDEPDRPYGRAYSAATVDKTRTHAELRLHLGGGGQGCTP